MNEYIDSEDNNMQKNCHSHFHKNVPRKWSMLSYAGVKRVPQSEDPKAGSWPTYYINRNQNGKFVDVYGNPIAFRIRQPDSSIDFEGEQLNIVKETIQNISKKQRRIARYWGTGPATKQWTPIIDILIDTYNITAPRAARILAVTQNALNDAFVIAWYFKYLWKVARPNQFDQKLATILCTPLHPTYPSGHATIAGCAEIVLGYFFEADKSRLKELAKECAESRLYAGVHFPIDNEQGLILGRQIGNIVVSIIDKQYDEDQSHIDYPIIDSKNPKLPPPPYKQVISYKGSPKCNSKLVHDECDSDDKFCKDGCY